MTSGPSHSVQVIPNVTPMIDVMLVLLIIFMVTTPALIDGAPIAPPEAEHVRPFKEEPTDNVVGIDGAGAYYLNKQPIARNRLGEELSRIVRTSRQAVLYVRADKDLAYGAVDVVMDAARTSGIRMVGMISEAPPESSRPR